MTQQNKCCRCQSPALRNWVPVTAQKDNKNILKRLRIIKADLSCNFDRKNSLSLSSDNFCHDLNVRLVNVLNSKKMKIWTQHCLESSQDQICFQCLWGEGEEKLQPNTSKIVAFLQHKLDPGRFTVFNHPVDLFNNWYPHRDRAACINWGEADKVSLAKSTSRIGHKHDWTIKEKEIKCCVHSI